MWFYFKWLFGALSDLMELELVQMFKFNLCLTDDLGTFWTTFILNYFSQKLTPKTWVTQIMTETIPYLFVALYYRS